MNRMPNALAGALLVALALTACAADSDDATPEAATAAAPADGAATTPNRREYYDQRTGRYYYRDRSTGRYYWEDGTPRR